MKLLHNTFKHSHIGTEWERKTTTWEISLEAGDVDDLIFQRFAPLVCVEQIIATNFSATYYKGARTQWFTKDGLKDKQKLVIIDKMNNFIKNECRPNLVEWVETE